MFKKILLLNILTIGSYGLISCSDNDETRIIEIPTKIITPADILEKYDWVTTKVFDITDSNNPILQDNNTQPASFYVGYAYYEKDGSFAIYSLQDVIRLSGNWSVTIDGKYRILNAYNTDGTVPNGFPRRTEIIELTDKKFTYKIQNGTKWFSVEHEPTTHLKPQ